MSRIEFTVAVGIRAPIEPGEYTIGDRTVAVSYPERLHIGNRDAEMPKSLSTLFVVSWEDQGGEVSAQLRSTGHACHLPIYDVLQTISDLLLAFKLVRVGHYDGSGVRTIGRGDVLLYYSTLNGAPIGPANAALKNYPENNAWLDAPHPMEHGTTALATPYIGTATLPLARRYVRCFELIEHGFYAESFIVAFSLLDDTVQRGVERLLSAKGLSSKEAKAFLRGIKEDRLRMYLGPLLKVAAGADLETWWPMSVKAIGWVNTQRNDIAHNASTVDYSTAVHALFACIKALVVLHENKVVDAEFPVHLFREAKIKAAWTANPPAWVPTGEVAESMDFRS